MAKDEITLGDITTLTDALIAARNDANEAYEDYKVRKEARDAIQTNLHAALRMSDVKSIKRGDTTVSLRKRLGLAVLNEVEAIEWCKANGFGNTYVVERLNETFKRVAAGRLAEVGRIPDGCEVKETDFVSITRGRAPKE